jgi:hypothetical protein
MAQVDTRDSIIYPRRFGGVQTQALMTALEHDQLTIMERKVQSSGMASLTTIAEASTHT